MNTPNETATRQMSTAQLQELAVADLDPHPSNPRLVIREDVVDDIGRELHRTGFGREHAILAVPAGGRYRIVSGHHRVEAARRVGLTTIPAWVRDMDDDEQFFALVLANTQGELSPLEIGMHVLAYVTPGGPGRGKTGGISAYAERVGKTRTWISQIRAAAAVAAENRKSTNGFQLLDKATHLYEISRAPQPLWETLVNHLIGKGWSVADTQHYVEQIAGFTIPANHSQWLPLVEVVAHYLDTREFSPRTVTRLIAAADETFNWIAANDPHERGKFTRWLIDNKGSASWQPRAIGAYLGQLIASRHDVKGWYHGDWRDHLDQLEDGTVSLILVDPPYGQGFQSDYRLDRREPMKHAKITGDDAAAADELHAALEALASKLTDAAHVLLFCGWANEPDMRNVLTKAGFTLRGSIVWDKQATSMGDPDTTFAPAHERILHAVKGSPKIFRREADIIRVPRCNSDRHPTEKPVDLLRTLIEATTAEGQIVADPYGGVASTPVAAKTANRRWWSCEIDAKYHRIGEDRLA